VIRPRAAAIRGRLSPDVWAVVAIVVIVLVAHAAGSLGIVDPNPLGPRSGLTASVTPGPVRGSPAIDPNDGFISQAVSHRAALDVLHLHLPWWNPYEGSGAPMAAGMQSAALFPPTLLTALSNGRFYELMLLEMLAGIATYLLLRRIDIGRPASLAGGVAFALNGTFAWFAHATVNPVAFLPLLLLGFELARSATVADRRGGWWLIAVAGALSFYAGFPEVAYIDALLALCWFGWRCAGLERHRWRAFAGKALAGAVVGTLLCAPLLLAMVEYFNHADLSLHGTDFFSHVHVPAQAWSQLLLPYVFGPILGFTDPKFVVYAAWVNVGGFLSTSLLLLALAGLFSSGRKGLRGLLLAWIVVMIGRIYGVPVLTDLVNLVPGLSRVAVFRYCTASVELAVIVLAALGLDDLVGRSRSNRRVAWLALGALAVVAVAAINARSLADQLGSAFSKRPYYAGAVAWGVLVLVLLVAALLWRDRRWRAPLAALIVVVDSVLLFALPSLSAPRRVQVDLAPVTYLEQHLGTSRFFTLGPLAPNYGSYFGLASLNINDVPIPSAFAKYVTARLDHVVNPIGFVGNYGGGRPLYAPSPEQELLDNLDGYREAGVAYVLTPAGQALPQSPGTFTLVLRTPSTWIYHLAGAAPYFTTGSNCTATFAGRASARVSCASPTTLVRRETDLPGWNATVDGRSVAIRPQDGLFQAVTVPAGAHVVSFSYQPPGIVWGYLLFAAGCVGLVAPWLVGRLAPVVAKRLENSK
jgi:hypothetical protein